MVTRSSFQSILKVNVIAQFRDVYKYLVVKCWWRSKGSSCQSGPECMLAAGLAVINLWQRKSLLIALKLTMNINN